MQLSMQQEHSIPLSTGGSTGEELAVPADLLADLLTQRSTPTTLHMGNSCVIKIHLRSSGGNWNSPA